MKSDWLLPAIHFDYGRKGLKSPKRLRMRIGAASCFFTALRRQGDVRFAPESRHVQCAVPDVRFGPIADISQRTHHVLTPERGANQKHRQAMGW